MTPEPVRDRANLRVGLARLVPRGLPDELGVLAALVLLAVVIGILRPTFFQPYNLLTLVRSSSFFGIMAQKPEVLKTFLPFYGAITGPGALDQRYKELAYLKTSMVNGCVY